MQPHDVLLLFFQFFGFDCFPATTAAAFNDLNSARALRALIASFKVLIDFDMGGREGERGREMEGGRERGREQRAGRGG